MSQTWKNLSNSIEISQLRLPIKSQSEEWTEFFNTGTVIALNPRRKAKVNPGLAVLVGFMVTDLDDIVNKLKQLKKNLLKWMAGPISARSKRKIS